MRSWGVGLDGLRQWKDGKIENSLMELIYHFYLAEQMYSNHKNDAVNIEQQNRAKKAKS